MYDPIEELDHAEWLGSTFDAARLELLARAIGMCERATWHRSGARTLATWLATYTGMESPEARRFARLAELAHRHPALADAVLDGDLSFGRAELLAAHAAGTREELLDDSLGSLLDQHRRLHRHDDWARLLHHWCELVDQELSAPPRSHRHEVHVSQTLFGGGEIHGWLDPEALVTITAGLDAFMPSPDPVDGPVPPRTAGQRRADALTDMAAWGLRGEVPDDDGPAPDVTHDDDPPVTRPRSAATTNVVIDLRTFAGDRRYDDLDDFELRSDRWRVGRSVAEQLICDSGLVATLMDGHRTVLDASDRSEQFTAAQRRALAVRDRGCVFPSCDRPAKHTDAHHLHPRSEGGTDRVDDAALNCRHHHRLLHRGWRLRFDTSSDRWIATDPQGIDWRGEPRGSRGPTERTRRGTALRRDGGASARRWTGHEEVSRQSRNRSG
ncbi:DUF222 domain-containing protein [Actinospongicola halichondriae]|uniref:HNH endonuclease signature motif containing protein n=1 Tax=Actinospongicola halichondriae TaxID=3236844 RepID=UPI003D482628